MNPSETKMIEAARAVLKAAGYFVDNLWHVEDVHLICKQNDWFCIDDNEAREVFTIANQQFDGETGISWPKLEKAVQVYLQRKAILNDRYE